MSRLVVNPDTPQAWEIQLKPGANLLGRGTASDFKIEDPSVSGSHCQIQLDSGRTVIRDLGSTNGTFVNSARIQEFALEHGHRIRLGAVELRYEGKVPATPPPVPPPMNPAAPTSIPAPVAGGRIGSLRIHSGAAPVPDTAEADAPAATPPADQAPAPLSLGPTFCKFHPKAPARNFCRKCNRGFCDACVSTRTIGGTIRKTCRGCGGDLVPLQVHAPAEIAPKGFFAQVPGAFIYPFRGTGIFLLIVGMIIFAFLKLGGLMFRTGNIRSIGFGVILQITVGGYLFTYMQSIIHATAVGDDKMPDLPGMSDFLEDILFPFFRLFGLVAVCFGPVVGLSVWAVMSQEPMVALAIIPALVLALFYFPMALLSVAILDSFAAISPLLVVPSIFRAPLEYLVATLLLGATLACSKVGDVALALLFPNGFDTPSIPGVLMLAGGRILLSFINIYLLAAAMRLLGLLYVTKKDRFGW